MRDIDAEVRKYNISPEAHYNEGLRLYFLKIYTLMSAGLFITAAAAFSVFSIPYLTNILFHVTPSGDLVGVTSFGWLITFAPLGISIYFSFGYGTLSANTAKILFWLYAALVGMSLASLGFIYTGISIIKTFAICSGTFASMSLYGYSTKKDLTSIESFLFMGLVGLILASLVNIFFRSPAIEFALSIIGVLVFIGLIAFDTQKLKELYYQRVAVNDKIGILAAFTLYLDFLNLFLYLLRFLGTEKENKR